MKLNKIYNEDCLETMSRMADNFIDLTVTSPPYDNLRDYKGYSFNFKSIAKELFRVTKEGGVVVWIVGDATINGSETGTSFKQALYFKECGFNIHDTMIYYRISPYPESIRYHQCFEYMFIFSVGKPNTYNLLKQKKRTSYRKGSVNKSYRQKDGSMRLPNKKDKERLLKSMKSDEKIKENIWKIEAGYGLSTTDKIAFKHPAIFPEKLASNHIYSWSNELDLVYDPFMGSGTTAKASHLLKRNWIGSEISKEYCDIANKRLEKHLNQTRLF